MIFRMITLFHEVEAAGMNQTISYCLAERAMLREAIREYLSGSD